MGAAGYDPEEPDMRGILLAKGPGTGELICGAYFWLRVQVQES
jgi:hypothetical protein